MDRSAAVTEAGGCEPATGPAARRACAAAQPERESNDESDIAQP
ncbi:hypothetical protein [Mycetohabitans endofungorum]